MESRRGCCCADRASAGPATSTSVGSSHAPRSAPCRDGRREARRPRCGAPPPGRDGAVSVWCGSLDGVSLVARDEHARHYAASTMKLPLLVAAYRLHERGALDLDRPVPVHNRFASAADGSAFALEQDDGQDDETWALLGSEASLRRLVRHSTSSLGQPRDQPRPGAGRNGRRGRRARRRRVRPAHDASPRHRRRGGPGVRDGQPGHRPRPGAGDGRGRRPPPGHDGHVRRSRRLLRPRSTGTRFRRASRPARTLRTRPAGWRGSPMTSRWSVPGTASPTCWPCAPRSTYPRTRRAR